MTSRQARLLKAEEGEIMPYITDERDIEFNLFEYLNMGELTERDRFKDHNVDLYKMVASEGLKFCMNEFDPIYQSGDREGCELKDGVVRVPKGYKEAYKKTAENGFLAVDIPTTYGGQGLPIMLNTLLFEHFAGSNICMALYIGLTRGSGFLIESFGSEEVAKLFCEKMYTGQWGGTMCLTEPQAGTAVGDLKTTAKKNDDGTYSIKGNKIFISSGDHDITDNIIHLVLARVDGDTEGTKGISLFAVPKIWANPDGSLGEANDVNCVNIEHKMGIQASATCSLNFGENDKCRGFLVGEQSKGMRYMFKMMNEARLLCAMQGLAIGSTAYLNAVKYAKERVQGNDTAIIDYPNVRRQLSLCKSWVEGMRGLLYTTAKCIDDSETHPDEAMRKRAQNRADLLTPICKAYCSDTGFRITEKALQVFGGYGYISEYPMEQYLRDVKIASIYEGTNGIQALDLVGRKLSINNGELFREYYEEVSAFVTKHEEHEELKDEMASLRGAANTIGQVAMKFAEWGMGGQQTKVMLGATAFLEMMGHALCAHVLVEQAVIAAEKLKTSKDVFYSNKIKTAKFFVAQVLPQVKMCAKGILSGDETAMEIEF
jgi:alkylation response protein AidB-like acyl-CoA dehydrogenase